MVGRARYIEDTIHRCLSRRRRYPNYHANLKLQQSREQKQVNQMNAGVGGHGYIDRRGSYFYRQAAAGHLYY